MSLKTLAGLVMAAAWMCLPAAIAASAEALDADNPLAARYPGDAGIQKDPAVIFADDFESWTAGGVQPPTGAWSAHRNNVSRTRVVPGKVAADGPGVGVLEIACWTPGSGSQAGGLSLKLGNYDHAGEGRGDGYEDLFVRYYIKFDENYRGVANHGANLGGRDLSRPNSAWVGMAAIRDPASRGYFYSGLQPYGKNDSRELEMGFYSYHLDKKDQWGANYEVQKHMPIRVGGWHCVERHMKLNSVTAAGEANADGIEELWVDGQLTIRNAVVRFRRTSKLRITFFSLETYYHGLPKDYDASHPIKVFFDNLVIARKYIGPIGGKPPAPSASTCAGEKRNLLEDGASFEVGVDGFSLNNFYLLTHQGREIRPVFDAATAVDGKYSLRLDNPLGDKIVLAFRPIRLQQNTNVTVSGYMKGEGKARVQLMRWPFDTVASANVDLTSELRRFSFRGTIKKDQSYFLWVLPTVSTRRIWLDAIQIEEGDLSDFHPKPLELAAATTAPYNTYWVGDRCALAIRLYAPRPPESIPVSVKVLEIFRKEVFNRRLSVATQGRQHVDVSVPLFPGDRRGSYKVIVEAGQAGAIEKEVFTFGVLKEVPRADPFFAFNLKQVFNEDDERRYSDNNAEMDLVYANAPLWDTLGLMRKVGAGSLRCFRIAEHPRIEKRSGEFVWRDGYLELQKQAGLEPPLVVLNAPGPLWEADPAFPPSGRRWAMPTMDAWRNYIRAMVRHYKGKVRYYEVVNEPETVFRDVNAYVERLKAAHDVIREEDPEAKIVAPSYSGGDPYRWLEAFCKAGGHRWVDIWAIHYAGRTLPERGMDRTTPTWEQVRKYREILVKANGGADKPFWNTEGGSFYWTPEYDHWPRAEDQGYEEIGDEHYRIPSETLVAAYVPRLQLIEKASGLDREYSFEFGFYYSQNASKATDVWSMYVNYDGSPSPALVTYNAVADLFAGTKPVELLALKHQVVAAVFERGGRSVAAVWKGALVTEYPGFEQYDRPIWVDLDLKPPSLELTDMLGNPLHAEERGSGVRLTAMAYPVYFTSSASPEEVVKIFRSARLAEGPRPKIDATPESLIEARQYSAALAVLEERLAATPADARCLAKTGTCCMALKRFEEAMRFFNKALAADPDLGEANRGMARCHERYDKPGVSWAQRMAGAAECMGRAVRPVVARVQAEGKGSYSDLVDIATYEYYLSGSTHVRGNAARALAMIALAQKIVPGDHWRVQAMLKYQGDLEKAAARDAAKAGKP